MSEKSVFEGKIFSVSIRTMMDEGHEIRRDIVRHPEGVALCCVMDHKILLVRQPRAAVEQETLEIPAGTREPGESPELTGMRELNEEAGLACDSLRLITSFWPTPGYDTETIWVYEAVGLRPVENRRPMDPDEHISDLWIDLNDAYRMIQDGTIRDGKTIIAIQHVLLNEKAGCQA